MSVDREKVTAPVQKATKQHPSLTIHKGQSLLLLRRCSEDISRTEGLREHQTSCLPPSPDLNPFRTFGCSDPTLRDQNKMLENKNELWMEINDVTLINGLRGSGFVGQVAYTASPPFNTIGLLISCLHFQTDTAAIH